MNLSYNDLKDRNLKNPISLINSCTKMQQKYDNIGKASNGIGVVFNNQYNHIIPYIHHNPHTPHILQKGPENRHIYTVFWSKSSHFDDSYKFKDSEISYNPWIMDDPLSLLTSEQSGLS